MGSSFCAPRQHLLLCERRRKKYVSICALYEHCVERKNDAEKKDTSLHSNYWYPFSWKRLHCGDSIHHTRPRQTWLSWASSSLFIWYIKRGREREGGDPPMWTVNEISHLQCNDYNKAPATTTVAIPQLLHWANSSPESDSVGQINVQRSMESSQAGITTGMGRLHTARTVTAAAWECINSGDALALMTAEQLRSAPGRAGSQEACVGSGGEARAGPRLWALGLRLTLFRAPPQMAFQAHTASLGNWYVYTECNYLYDFGPAGMKMMWFDSNPPHPLLGGEGKGGLMGRCGVVRR